MEFTELTILKDKFTSAARDAGYAGSFFWSVIGSTNDEAKRMFSSDHGPDREPDCDSAHCRGGGQGVRSDVDDAAMATNQETSPESAVFWALEQTSGRGRLGRSWESSPGDGIYMSFTVPAEGNVSAITIAAGVYICIALRSCGYDARLKWPNDVLVDGRKVCGILSEWIINENGRNHIVVGAGLNVSRRFSGALSETAISLVDAQRSVLIAEGAPEGSAAESVPKLLSGSKEDSEMFAHMRRYIFGTSKKEDLIYGMELMIRSVGRVVRNFRREDLPGVIELAKKYSSTLGCEVEVHNVHDRGGYTATARDIDIDGALVIELPNGEKKRIFAGEVTLKKRSDIEKEKG